MSKLVAAAIKFKPKNCDYFQIMCGKRHCDVFELMYNLRIEYDKTTAIQGFLTEDNQFLNRYDAALAAYYSGQLSPDTELWKKIASTEHLTGDPNLYSEDLW